MTKTIRTTVTMSQEVYEVYKHMAEVGKMSVSRCMGEWLTDTVDGALYLTQKMDEARRRPFQVMTEMKGLTEALDGVIAAEITRLAANTAPPAPAAAVVVAVDGALTPSSNYGVKVSRKAKK